MKHMFDRLDVIKKRYYEIDNLLQQDEVISDFEKYKNLSKEQSELKEATLKYEEYLKEKKNSEDLKEIRSDKDKEISEMAKEEYPESLEKLEQIKRQLEIILTPKDPNDKKNVIVEIRGAAGGDEANIFAGDLFRMYCRYGDSQNWKIETLNSVHAPMGGYSLISFSVRGNNVYSRLKFESGAHRVQRVPKTESQGRLHTSTATVIVMPEAEEVDIEIRNEDLRFDTFRSSGAGGQHVNTTDSAVRITHIPTGVVAECQDERSQHNNRHKAMIALRTKLLDQKIREEDEKRSSEIKSKLGTGDRAEKIRTYNYPQNRVSDHRINLSLKNLDQIMQGDLDTLIDALVNEDLKEKISGE